MENYENTLLSHATVNEKCTQYISKFYPIGKQLTLSRTGDAEDLNKMHTFIDACVAWANSANPQLKDLLTIKP